MDLAEFERMKRIHDYVWSTEPNSLERTKRLEEIQKNYPEEDSKLWDFHSGLLSGRIKKPEAINKESEVNGMNKEKKITNFEDFKKALVRTGTYNMLCEFKRNHPEMYKHYTEKLEAEKVR